jgi:hypothetical protein
MEVGQARLTWSARGGGGVREAGPSWQASRGQCNDGRGYQVHRQARR